MDSLATVPMPVLVAEIESRRKEFGGASIPVIGKDVVIEIISNLLIYDRNLNDEAIEKVRNY